MNRELIGDRRPFPDGVTGRLRDQLRFLVEIDGLKAVLRQSPLAAVERRENDAEHSWHLAMTVLLLAEYADEPVDTARAVELVLIHDLVEIYAGDTPIYDSAALDGQDAREQLAADRLFTLLPPDQAERIRARWDEFEARETPEARFAKAVDRFQPLLLDWIAGGGTWRTPGVTAALVRERTSAIGDASQRLESVAHELINAADRQGWLG